jgi:predicted esterase
MTRPVTSHVIRTATHGRYLVQQPAGRAPVALLVGFHGYGETAETQMERLALIPGAELCLLVSIQGLYRFYLGRTQRVGAGWMTAQDRELAIADNKVYVEQVVGTLAVEFHATVPIVFSGFSQGVAMAFRAACASALQVAAVVAAGGDVPPELDGGQLARLKHVLIGRGERDEWYDETKRVADLARLNAAGVQVEAPVLDAAHEWTLEFCRLAGAFLERLI